MRLSVPFEAMSVALNHNSAGIYWLSSTSCWTENISEALEREAFAAQAEEVSVTVARGFDTGEQLVRSWSQPA